MLYRIAEEDTAEKRFVACLRFYFSTISAGRDSASLKKPYNPILGEVFRCFYDHPSLPAITNPPEFVS